MKLYPKVERTSVDLMQQSYRNLTEKQDHEKDNPALNKVIERNIRTIIHLRTKAARERSLQNRIADAITSLSGRMIFAYVHIVWFGIWVLLNSGLFGLRVFDPFPYGLLTMVVSLEAIFHSTFVLISQDRLSEETERRADDVLAEIERLHTRELQSTARMFAMRM